ncbi:MAG: hypothetical protein H6706_04465 [Myxococcales bacterium]|nr:hypothetical protein [Myxococcales bacterium]
MTAARAVPLALLLTACIAEPDDGDERDAAVSRLDAAVDRGPPPRCDLPRTQATTVDTLPAAPAPVCEAYHAPRAVGVRVEGPDGQAIAIEDEELGDQTFHFGGTVAAILPGGGFTLRTGAGDWTFTLTVPEGLPVPLFPVGMELSVQVKSAWAWGFSNLGIIISGEHPLFAADTGLTGLVPRGLAVDVDREGLCLVNGEGYDGIEQYRLAVTHTGGTTRLLPGGWATLPMADGYPLAFTNLMSHQPPWTDDYWNYAWVAYAIQCGPAAEPSLPDAGVAP